MEEEKLLPCPFCGGDAISSYSVINALYFVECTDCYANIGHYDGKGEFETEQEAIAAWNRRVST